MKLSATYAIKISWSRRQYVEILHENCLKSFALDMLHCHANAFFTEVKRYAVLRSLKTCQCKMDQILWPSPHRQVERLAFLWAYSPSQIGSFLVSSLPVEGQLCSPQLQFQSHLHTPVESREP